MQTGRAIRFQRNSSTPADDGPLSKIAFGTEGGLFHERLGVSTVICGPGHIRDAHKADEFVSQDQMTQCTHMLDRLLAELAP